jgi:hypothetical protein
LRFKFSGEPLDVKILCNQLLQELGIKADES